jgi:hypothetical protein
MDDFNIIEVLPGDGDLSTQVDSLQGDVEQFPSGVGIRAFFEISTE